MSSSDTEFTDSSSARLEDSLGYDPKTYFQGGQAEYIERYGPIPGCPSPPIFVGKSIGAENSEDEVRSWQLKNYHLLILLTFL